MSDNGRAAEDTGGRGSGRRRCRIEVAPLRRDFGVASEPHKNKRSTFFFFFEEHCRHFRFVVLSVRDIDKFIYVQNILKDPVQEIWGNLVKIVLQSKRRVPQLLLFFP